MKIVSRETLSEEELSGVKAVIATRCEKHARELPVNTFGGDGSECAICALIGDQGPPIVNRVRYVVTCEQCRFVAQGSLSEIEAARWERQESLGSGVQWVCAACSLGLTRA